MAKTHDERVLEALYVRKRGAEMGIARLHKAHIDMWMPERPEDEPHDAQCRVTRHGAFTCTCESNRQRRLEMIKRAGVAGDTIVLDSLGSNEASYWHKARAEADPDYKDPYARIS